MQSNTICSRENKWLRQSPPKSKRVVADPNVKKCDGRVVVVVDVAVRLFLVA